MEIFSEDIEIKEITIEDVIQSNDLGKVIIKGENVGKRNEGESDLVKEITAIDALTIGASEAARINGVPQSSASKYSDGKDIADDETRARVNQHKYNIADTATAKLMETLGLFDPNGIEKQTDIIRAAQGLATIVEKISDKGKNSGNEIHLHMYAPKQKSLDKYKVIDV
jgi:hypothetical protein